MKEAVIIAVVGLVSIIVYSVALGMPHLGSGFMHGHGRYWSGSDPIARGGRGYDKFWVEYELDTPEKRHVSYPKIGQAKPADSWRCKECHGWDYMGDQGAYRSGSHFTGIAGIGTARVESVESVMGILKNEIHRYDTVLPTTALKEIATFVVEGRVDMSAIINYETKVAVGNRDKGKASYNNICADCHGLDGKALNFSHDAEEYIGTVASNNPWEALHKMRNGHPGAFIDHMTGRHTDRRGMGTHAMPSMRIKLSLEGQGNLLSYMQSLPTQ
jgi:thiosulfate dehydrogenase